jgi:hypothetical protein
MHADWLPAPIWAEADAIRTEADAKIDAIWTEARAKTVNWLIAALTAYESDATEGESA